MEGFLFFLIKSKKKTLPFSGLLIILAHSEVEGVVNSLLKISQQRTGKVFNTKIYSVW
jgi:hypothetical protein